MEVDCLICSRACGIPVVVLDPLHVELLEQLGHPQHALGAEVVVEIEAEADLGSHRVAEGADQPLDRVEDLHGGGAVGGVDAAREAREVHGGGIARDHHVGLERGEAAGHHFLAERGDVGVGAQRRRAQHVAEPRARRPAVRPVQPHAVAHRAAEELVDRHAEGLGLDVPERQLDAGHRLVAHAAQVLARGAQHVPVQALDRPRILADQQRGQVLHRARDAVRAAIVAAFSPAHEAVVGLDANEGPGPPAAVTVQGFHARDLHGSRRCHSPRARTRAGRGAAAGEPRCRARRSRRRAERI